MSKPKICPKCQREYEQEHMFCSICGVSLIPNPSYLSEQDSLKCQGTVQAPKKEYSDFQYESAEKEFTEKTDYMIERFKFFEDEYGVRKKINGLYEFRADIRMKLHNKYDLEAIKEECDIGIKDFILFYTDLAFNDYLSYLWNARPMGHDYSHFYDAILEDKISFFFSPSIDGLKNFAELHCAILKYFETDFIAYGKRNENIYKNTKLAREEAARIPNDINTLKGDYNNLVREYKLKNDSSFIPAIIDVAFLRKWQGFCNRCNSLIVTHLEAFDRVKYASI